MVIFWGKSEIVLNMPLFYVVAIVSVFVSYGDTSGSDSLMQCSKFHFEEKVLEKLVHLEFKMKNHEKMIETWTTDLKIGLKKIEKLKRDTEQFVDAHKLDISDIKKTVLQRIENETENMNNNIADRMVSFDKIINDKMVEIDDAEKNNSRHIGDMRQELEITIDSVYQNRSVVTEKLDKVTKDFERIRGRQVVAFSAYLSASSPCGTDIVIFNNIWTNVGSSYNPTTGVFTAPKDGLYSFTTVLLSQSGVMLFRQIWRNNKPVAATHATGDGYKPGTISIVLNLNESDEVYVKSQYANHGGVFSNNYKYSTFTGFLIT